MAAIKTDSNQPVELDYAELIKRLDHIDHMVYELHAALMPHKDALTRAASLLDPGKGIRDALGRKRRG